MLRGVVACAVVLPLSAAIACGRLEGADPSSAPPDGSVDGAVSDATLSGTGFRPVTDAGSCATPGTIVCADFENAGAGLPQGGFDRAVGTIGGFLDLASDNGQGALHASTGSLTGGAIEEIYLSKELDRTPSMMRFGMRIRRGSKNVDRYVEYLVVQTSESDDLTVAIAGDPTNGMKVAESSGTTTGVTEHVFDGFPTGYVRIDVQLWFEPSGTSMQVWKNGSTVYPRQPLSSPAGKKAITGKLRFGAGLYYVTGPTSGFDAFLDDVTLAVLP